MAGLNGTGLNCLSTCVGFFQPQHPYSHFTIFKPGGKVHGGLEITIRGIQRARSETSCWSSG